MSQAAQAMACGFLWRKPGQNMEAPPYCVFRPNPATIPTGKRPPFRRESGQHSDSIPATIPEQSGQCDLRV